VLLLVHDKPEALGAQPDGAGRGAAAATPPPAIEGMTLREALGSPAFYIVAAGLFSMSMLVTALHFFQVSIFAAHGLSAQVAALVFPVSAAAMVVAMPLLGRMLDRFPTHLLFAGGLLVMAATLVGATMIEGLASALAYAVMFGVNNAATMTFFGFMWPRYFGRRHLGSIQGTGQMIGVVGASLGPLPFGLAYDLTGGYVAALLGSALFPLLCAALALFLREPAAPPRG
jgi:MFS family permease